MREMADFQKYEPVDQFRVLKRLRDDINKLERIKSESDSPSDTVDKFRKRVGIHRADDIIASLVNAHNADGRICIASREWAKRVDHAWSPEFMRRKMIYGTMHPAHLDQIALAASKGVHHA